MAWQTPKINWTKADSVTKDDLNRIEGNSVDLSGRLRTAVTSLAALKAINTTDTTLFYTGTIICLTGVGLFQFDRASVAAGNDITVVAPTTGGGRWLAISSKGYELGVGPTIPDGANFDTYNSLGTFAVPSSANLATMTNAPPAAAGGKLIVEYLGSTSIIRQVYETNGANCTTWERSFNVTWSSWVKTYTTSDKPTLPELNARYTDSYPWTTFSSTGWWTLGTAADVGFTGLLAITNAHASGAPGVVLLVQRSVAGYVLRQLGKATGAMTYYTKLRWTSTGLLELYIAQTLATANPVYISMIPLVGTYTPQAPALNSGTPTVSLEVNLYANTKGIPITEGGTDGVTAAEARTNLDVVRKSGDTGLGALQLNDKIDVKSPGVGTTGGVRIRADDNGNTYIQFVTADGTGQLGYICVTAAGLLYYGTNRIYTAGYQPTSTDVGADVTGSYVGTGTYGSGNTNSLTFARPPKRIEIWGENAGFRYIIRWIGGATAYGEMLNYGAGQITILVTNGSVSGNVFSWYSTENADRQLNATGVTYRYVVSY